MVSRSNGTSLYQHKNVFYCLLFSLFSFRQPSQESAIYWLYLIKNLKTQYYPLCFTRLCYCLCLHGSEASIVFRDFAFLVASIQLPVERNYYVLCISGLFKLAILKYVLKCCLINKVHE